MRPKFFAGPVPFRRWLRVHHATAAELLVGFRKVGSGKPSITWPESVDEALCVGWIDGVRRRVDDEVYTVRFTPRRASSSWSAVNLAKAKSLIRAERMQATGLAAYEAHRPRPGGHYSYEQRPESLPPPYARVLNRNRAAAAYFAARPASYRRAAIWWVVSARHAATRTRRLEALVAVSARAEPIPQFTRRPSAR